MSPVARPRLTNRSNKAKVAKLLRPLPYPPSSSSPLNLTHSVDINAFLVNHSLMGRKLDKTRQPSVHRSREKTKLQIATLMGNPQVKSVTEIAKRVGVTRQYASALAQELKAELAPIDEALAEYKREFDRTYNVANRATRYQDLAKQDAHPMVALKALERIDALVGIVTERERREADSHPTHAPMFYMPGAQVVVQNMGENAPQQVVGGDDSNPNRLSGLHNGSYRTFDSGGEKEPAGPPPAPPSEEDP